MPPPPQDPDYSTLGPRPAPPSSASSRPLPSPGASAPTSRPVTSLLPAPPLPVVFTPEELARELEGEAKEGSDDSSDASSEDEKPSPGAKSESSANQSDPFHSAKSATCYADAAAAAENALSTFDKVYAKPDAAGSKRREALVKQVDQLRENAERAHNVGAQQPPPPVPFVTHAAGLHHMLRQGLGRGARGRGCWYIQLDALLRQNRVSQSEAA
jgi:hypothetical protein